MTNLDAIHAKGCRGRKRPIGLRWHIGAQMCPCSFIIHSISDDVVFL